MYYIYNENGLFLFETNGDYYQNKTTIKPPFEEYSIKDYDFIFNKNQEKWIAREKPKINMIENARQKRDKKILKKSSYNTIGGIKILKSEQEK